MRSHPASVRKPRNNFSNREVFRDPVPYACAQFCNEICWITPLATWANAKFLARTSEVRIIAAKAVSATLTGAPASETVLLRGREESKFTQTTV